MSQMLQNPSIFKSKETDLDDVTAQPNSDLKLDEDDRQQLDNSRSHMPMQGSASDRSIMEIFIDKYNMEEYQQKKKERLDQARLSLSKTQMSASPSTATPELFENSRMMAQSSE